MAADISALLGGARHSTQVTLNLCSDNIPFIWVLCIDKHCYIGVFKTNNKNKLLKMASSLMQFFGFSLALAGFIGLIVCTTMSEWKTSSHPGPSLLTAQTTQEGLWMSCVTYSTGQVNCKVFESLLEQSSKFMHTAENAGWFSVLEGSKPTHMCLVTYRITCLGSLTYSLLVYTQSATAKLIFFSSMNSKKIWCCIR